MEKHTFLRKGHSGVKLYDYNGSRVEAMPYFLYEVTIGKHWKNGYAQLGSRFFKTGHILKIKKPLLIKEYDGYFIEKSITLLGITPQFIKENNVHEYLPVIKPKRKRCKKLQG